MRAATIHLLVPITLATGCLFPMSHAEIEAANTRHVQRMCSDQNYAYESGYNRGLDRGRLDTTWVDTSCAPEWREPVRQSYQLGYNTGIQNAPIVLNNRATITSSHSCRFSSDCDDGQSCRTNVCMGGGYAGDPCWFSSDCVSGSCDVASKSCR